MENNSKFESEFENLVIDQSFQKALQLLEFSKDKLDENVAFNFVTKLCVIVKTNNLLDNDSNFEQCQKLLLFLIKHGKPKEILVALMEEADAFKHHNYFCFLLEPLKIVLKRIPGKRGKSLEWILSTLNAHISTLELPQDLDLQGEEKLLLDTDPAVVNTNYVLGDYLDFLSAFVNEVSYESMQKKEHYYEERIVCQRFVLQKFILMLFNHPLLYHDLHVMSDSKPKSTIRILCERCVKYLSQLSGNVFSLFNHFVKTKSRDDDDEPVSNLSFSNLAYLIFVEKLFIDMQPYVYSHVYIFIQHLEHATAILSKSENLVLFKGLHLAKTLLDRLQPLEIQNEYLDIDTFSNFPTILLKISILCPIEVHRNLAIKIFRSYIEKLDWKGRYRIIFLVLSTIKHSGAEGLVINMYQSYLHTCLQSSSTNGNTTFMGKNLTTFIKKVFILEDGVETDILENSDRIISSLNFLRYLLLRDKKETNQTGIWNHIKDISVGYLENLLSALNLSRAHYKQAALDSKDKMKSRMPKTSINVNKETLLDSTPVIEEEVYKKAILTFDVIESIFFRVRELY